MKKHRWLCAFLTAFLLVGCATTEASTDSSSAPDSSSSQSSSVPDEKEEFVFSLTGGEARWNVFEGASEYRVVAGASVLGKTQACSFDVVETLKEKVASLWGEWNILVDALDSKGQVLASHSEKMKIRALNARSFQTALSGAYSANDYFMLEEDIYYYGHDDPTFVNSTPEGYTFAELIYYGEGMKGFVAKEFSATLDGNGYTVNLLVDKPLKYRADLQMVAGGMLTSVTSTGVLKNLVVNTDYTYPQASGQFSGTVVYKDFAGRIEDCWFNTIFRPIASDPHIVTKEFSYTYEYDERASIIGSVKDGAVMENSVFTIEFMDINGNVVEPQANGKMGGAVCVSYGTCTYNNCVFIQKDGAPRFINDTWSVAKAWKGASPAQNVYYYATIDDFLTGTNGFVFNGDFKESETYVETDALAYEGWSELWEIAQDEVYLGGALAYVK